MGGSECFAYYAKNIPGIDPGGGREAAAVHPGAGGMDASGGSVLPKTRRSAVRAAW